MILFSFSVFIETFVHTSTPESFVNVAGSNFDNFYHVSFQVKDERHKFKPNIFELTISCLEEAADVLTNLNIVIVQAFSASLYIFWCFII